MPAGCLEPVGISCTSERGNNLTSAGKIDGLRKAGFSAEILKVRQNLRNSFAHFSILLKTQALFFAP